MTIRKLASDIGFVFIAQIIALVSNVLISVILGRFFGVAPFGHYMMTLTIYSVASLFGGIGIPEAIIKYVAQFRGNKYELNILVSCGILNSLFFGAIIGLVLFILSSTLADIFNMIEISELIKITAFSLPFLTVNNSLLGLLIGLKSMKSYALRTIIRSSLLISFTIGIVGSGLGIKGAVLALLLSEVGTLSFLIWATKNLFNFNINSDFIKTTKELVKFGSQVFFANAIYIANTYMDTLLVGYFLLDKDVGVYAIALSIAKGLLLVPGSISTVTYPTISEYNSKESYKSIENLINKSIKYSMIILSILGLLIIFLSKDIISFLLNPEFFPAISPIAILVVGMIFFGSMLSIGSVFSAFGRPDISFKTNMFTTLINLCLNIILIPILGVTGAAISTTISFSLLTILTFYMLIRILNIKLDIRWYMQFLTILISIIASFFVFKKWINIYLLASVLFLSYLILLNKFFILKDIRRDIKQIVRS